MSNDWIYINKFVFGDEEKAKLQECIESDWFAGNSKFNKEFEKQIEKFSGLKHFQTTNSGSAALEIAIQILVQSGKIKAGDKFLHPAVTFPTSLSSAIMAGMIPVYVDVDEGTYQISTEGMKQAIIDHPDIQFAIIPALLGNVPDVETLKDVMGDRPIIFDSCDVMGGKFDGREFISYGDLGAYSFYGSHTISTFGVGGGLGTNDDNYYALANSMTFWGRDFSTDNLDMVQNFLKRYSYQTLGLDAQMTAAQAAVGLAQLSKIYEFIGERERIFGKLQSLFSKHQKNYILPTRVSDRADPSWFCYPLTVRENSSKSRNEIANYLLQNKVEIRPIMAGNILYNQPFVLGEHYVVGELTEANKVYDRGFFIPCYPMTKEVENKYFNILGNLLDG